jgi:hypothetical protein
MTEFITPSRRSFLAFMAAGALAAPAIVHAQNIMAVKKLILPQDATAPWLHPSLVHPHYAVFADLDSNGRYHFTNKHLMGSIIPAGQRILTPAQQDILYRNRPGMINPLGAEIVRVQDASLWGIYGEEFIRYGQSAAEKEKRDIDSAMKRFGPEN